MLMSWRLAYSSQTRTWSSIDVSFWLWELYQRLIDDGVEEKEARYIARDNADFRAKDIAYSEVSDYRRNYKYFKEW